MEKFLCCLPSCEGGMNGMLVGEALHRNPSSFPVPQTAPPFAKAGTIDIGRRSVQFMSPQPTSSFTICTIIAGSGIPLPPIAILTLVGLVRVPARP